MLLEFVRLGGGVQCVGFTCCVYLLIFGWEMFCVVIVDFVGFVVELVVLKQFRVVRICLFCGFCWEVCSPLIFVSCG